MSNGSDGSVIIEAQLNIDETEKGLDKLNNALDEYGKTASSTFDKASKSIDSVTEAENKHARAIEAHEKEWDALNSVISAQSKEVDKLRERFDILIKRRDSAIEAGLPRLFSAEEGDELRRLEKQIANTEYSIAKLESKSEKMADTMDKLEAETVNAADGTEKLGKASNETSKDVNVLETALTSMIIQGLAKTVDSMMDVVDSTKQFRKQLASVELSAKAYGKNLEDVDYIIKGLALSTDDMNEALNATSALLAIGFNDNQMLDAMEAINGAVLKFGDEFSSDELANDIQKTFEQGAAVGQFANLLKKAGIDVAEFNKELQNANTTAQKHQVILNALESSGLAEYADQWRALNPELAAAQEAQMEYNMALADLGDKLQPVETGIMKVKTKLLEFIDSLGPGALEFAGFSSVIVSEIFKIISTFLTLKAAMATINISKSLNAAKVSQEVTSVGTATQAAGTSAGAGAAGFLKAAAGIALIGVSIAAIILSLSVLVTAFKETGDSALEVSLAIVMLVAATGGLVVALAMIGKTAVANAAGLLTFSFAVGVLAASVSIIILSLSALVSAMGNSESSVIELAAAVSIIVIAIVAGIAAIIAIGVAASAAAPQLLVFAAAVAVIALSVAALVEAITGLIYAIQGIPPINVGFNGPTGYATGTASATKGWHIVGENGPELSYFSGGEHVLTASQTAAQGLMTGGSRGEVRNYYFGGVSIPARDVREFTNVIDIMNRESSSIQQGYVGVH